VFVAGVNDEPSPTWNLDEGLDVLDELGIKFVELRAADGQTVDQMEDATFAQVARRVQERGFIITTYLGQLGQCVPDESNRPQEMQRLRRAIARADSVGARQIRLMGFQRGEGGVDWHHQAVELLKELADTAAQADKILVFENPPNAGTAAVGTAQECLEALRSVGSPHLRLNLDPGNFGAHGEDALAAYETLKEYVGNVHVKDIGVPGDQSSYCIAGDGACRYPEIFQGLARQGYDGYVTAEPHLAHAQKYHTSGREGFMAAATRMVALLEEAGFSVVKSPH
jgi:sugar phosphate isomerase/epimerase